VDWLIEGVSTVVRWLRDPGELIEWGGYPALALIVFLETGAMVFFLPGDSLLVMAGLYAAKGDFSLAFLNLLLIPAAIAGDATSYWIGSRTGPHIFTRPRSRMFRPEHVRAAHDFYERYGPRAIVLARFVPVVRTFVPVVAGVAQMTYRRFATYNVLGGAAWVVSMTCLGYFLGWRFPLLVRHVEKVIIMIVVLSILPALVHWRQTRKRKLPPTNTARKETG
jgi:membrane-associated protein